MNLPAAPIDKQKAWLAGFAAGRLAALKEVRETINHERKREAMNAREGRIYRNMRKIVDDLIKREEEGE